MAAVVSHAMRRFPTTPPDDHYSHYRVRSEASRRGRPGDGEAAAAGEGESALSRSMRYADPWLYGSVRAHAGLLLAPALLLCACGDSASRSRRSDPSSSSSSYTSSGGVCKRCRGARLPRHHDAAKFGTVRCYPTSGGTAAVPLRAGTVRVSSSSASHSHSRPSILPHATADPYDLMRRSRLAVTDSVSQFRARSISPAAPTKNPGEGGGRSAARSKGKPAETSGGGVTVSSPTGRRSILECNINPYELMSADSSSGKNASTASKDAGITLVNGQRIRVRPPQQTAQQEYEEVQVQLRRPQATSPQQPLRIPPYHHGGGKDASHLDSVRDGVQNNAAEDLSAATNVQQLVQQLAPSPCSAKKLTTSSSEKESELNRFKSILKKPSASSSLSGDTNGTIDNGGVSDQSPSPSRKTGSQFYLPMPTATRKKVQFAVEHNTEALNVDDAGDGGCKSEEGYQKCNPKSSSAVAEGNDHRNVEDGKKNHQENVDSGAEDIGSSSSVEDESTIGAKRECKLRRSVSERSTQGSTRVVFHDTMALRARHPRTDSRTAFSDRDLLRLDGLSQRLRKISPSATRPIHPPPPPPQQKHTNQCTQDACLDNKVDSKESSNRLANGNCDNDKVTTEGKTHGNVSVTARDSKTAKSVVNSKSAESLEEKSKKAENSKSDSEERDVKNIVETSVKYSSNVAKQTAGEKLESKINFYDKVNVPKTVWFGGDPNKICDEETTTKVSDFIVNSTEGECERRCFVKQNVERQASKTNGGAASIEQRRNEEGILDKRQQVKINEINPSKAENADTPPCAPPRKRSNNKQPQINIIQASSPSTTQTVKVHSPTLSDPPSSNRTIVKITPSPTTVHKLQIKNEFSETISCHGVCVLENPQRKTSILINGDDCYSTVNVNDDVPLYQSSVVVKDCGSDATITTCTTSRKSSSIYITGQFETTTNMITTSESSKDTHKYCNGNVVRSVAIKSDTFESTYGSCNGNTVASKLAVKEISSKGTYRSCNGNTVASKVEAVKEESSKGTYRSCNGNTVGCVPSGTEAISEKTRGEEKTKNHNGHHEAVTKDYVSMRRRQKTMGTSHPIDRFSEENIPSTELLKRLLKDPVEAVRRNLVPHVCGKSDVPRRQRDKKFFRGGGLLNEPLAESPREDDAASRDGEESLGSYESMGDDASEHSSSTQYEPMDNGSECYTDHSNRSSVTEDELANRTKFYELLADSGAVEVSENEDHHYETIKMNSDPIYEEIEMPPPLPANPPPTALMDDLNLDKEFTTRSIFEGASKYDILSYLVDAKERGIVPEDTYTFNFNNSGVAVEEDTKEQFPRICHLGSTVSDSSEDNSLITHLNSPLIDDKSSFQKTAEVERNDSGVGSETSKSSLSRYRIRQEPSATCEDCDSPVDNQAENEPLICRKCVKKRSERKEIITEIVETEEKYSRDLQIILEEFYQPMLVAGLLTPDQLSAIFLNVEELLENSQALAERLRDAVEIAVENGDEDLLTVNIGKLFLEAAPMLHAFETYCVRQGAASLLLASLEKDKELLRIFLRVSQMENTLLRRMNLNSFLMVPVQRVTKYPLLLARLYKVTPAHHGTREHLREAQHKIELHLNHMNSETKDIPSKLWRRIGSSSGRRSSSEMDLVNIKLRKIAVDVLEWNHEEAKFALEGKLLFTQPTDNNWRKGRTIKLTPVNALLVTNGKPSANRGDKSDESSLIFTRHSNVREAALLLVRDKNGRYSLLREPLYLDRCIVAADAAWQSYFEVQELGKDTFIFKAEDDDQTRTWYRQLQHHAQGMGAWRKRRNALANIMINGMGLRS